MHLLVKVLPVADLFQKRFAAIEDPLACSSASVTDSFTMSPLLAPSVFPVAVALTIAMLVVPQTIPAATMTAVLSTICLESMLKRHS